MNINDITPHDDIKNILTTLSETLTKILPSQLIGLYIIGSLACGDFDIGSSDIDFLTVINQPLSKEQFEQIKIMHAAIEKKHPIWAARIESSYVTAAMLASVEPPKVPRPYINNGIPWEPFPLFGNEWIIYLYTLHKYGIALIGPESKTLINPIDIQLVKDASIKELHTEWEPKLQNHSSLNDSHNQAYAILTLCRILYLDKNSEVATKKVAAEWVQKFYGKPWINLIEQAKKWHYGKKLDKLEQALDFLRFTLREIG